MPGLFLSATPVFGISYYILIPSSLTLALSATAPSPSLSRVGGARVTPTSARSRRIPPPPRRRRNLNRKSHAIQVSIE